MNANELKTILENHRKWLNNEPGGIKADFTETDLIGADLRWAILEGAILEGAILEGAILEGANLYMANLREADLRGANLEGANLRGADLTYAKLPDYLITPKEGSFIAYKKVRGGVVLKLEILGKRMNSLVGRKCRTDKAKVLEALGSDGKEFCSLYDPNFIYRVGEIVEAPLNDDIRIKCTTGIHFFMTEQEAREY